MAAKDWLSQPPPQAPGRLWTNDARVPHRTKRSGFYESRQPSQAEEQYAVEEALRSAHVALWRDLYQRMTFAEKRVKELEAENRKLRMNPGPA